MDSINQEIRNLTFDMSCEISDCLDGYKAAKTAGLDTRWYIEQARKVATRYQEKAVAILTSEDFVLIHTELYEDLETIANMSFSHLNDIKRNLASLLRMARLSNAKKELEHNRKKFTEQTIKIEEYAIIFGAVRQKDFQRAENAMEKTPGFSPVLLDALWEMSETDLNAFISSMTSEMMFDYRTLRDRISHNVATIENERFYRLSRQGIAQ